VREFLESVFGKDSALTKKAGYWIKVSLFGLAGVILLVFGSLGEGARQPAAPTSASNEASSGPPEPSAIQREEKYLAEHLRAVLQEVEGAGAVEVTVRLAGSARQECAVNTTVGRRVTEEQDKAGTSRMVTEDNTNDQVVVVRGGQREEAVVTREEAPELLGVLVVADGAADPQVRLKLFHAVQVALGVAAHRILVLPRSGLSGSPEVK
jgi:stage III sporulation protein AG